MKEQNKTTETELNKMETSKLLDAEFKTQVIRMFTELRGRVDELSENFNKEIGNIKTEIENKRKTKSETKSTLTEMKNTLQGINSVVDESEKQINDLEYKEAKNI